MNQTRNSYLTRIFAQTTGTGTGTGTGGLPNLQQLYTNIDTYAKGNIVYVVIVVCLVAIFFFIFRGLRQDWGPKALKIGGGAIGGLFLFIFLPEIIGFVQTVANFFGGTNNVTIPGSGGNPAPTPGG